MPTAPTNFLAVLVFEEARGRRSIEPHVFTASHPEIAYRLALARGAEPRFARRFVGLAELEPTFEDPPNIGKTEGGDARELIRSKEELAAFTDARWTGVEPDPRELADALREPAALLALDGLDAVDWASLSHAYGPAADVPIDLRRLASADPEARREALWQLQGTIYHQGTLYDATPAAIGFLVRIATHPAYPDRCEVLAFLREIAQSTDVTEDQVRAVWVGCSKWNGLDAAATEKGIADTMATLARVRGALAEYRPAFVALASDPDQSVRDLVQPLARV
jgi:hypothetical protein